MIVRQATLDDQAALFEFIRRAYPGREQFKIPHRWQWQFQENPYCSSTKPPIWIALDGDRIVGQTGAMIEPLVFGEQTLPVGWSVDTMVLPSHRGQGLGGRLQRANQDHHPIFMSLKMASRNAKIKKKLGAFALPPVRVYGLRLAAQRSSVTARLQRFSRLAAGASQFLCADAVLAAAATAQARAKWRLLRREGAQSASTLNFEEIDQFGTETDELWDNLRHHFPVIVRRDSEYLNWKFVRQPHTQHRRYLVRRQQRDGGVCGYVILRRCLPPEPNLGLIVDLFASPTDRSLLTAMAVFAVDHLRSQGVTAVKTAASIEALEKVYCSLGFNAVKELTPLCHLAPNVADASRQVSHSFFSFGDHDLDQYPLTS